MTRSHIPIGSDIELGEAIAAAGDGALLGAAIASKTLHHDDIASLPTAPFEIIAATETLSYAAAPSTLPVPIFAYIVYRSPNGTQWGNAASGSTAQLVWGADFSLAASEFSNAGDAGNFTTMLGSGNPGDVALGTFGLPDKQLPSGLSNTLLDNGLYLAVDNTGNDNPGDPFTEGDVDGVMTIVLFYLSMVP